MSNPGLFLLSSSQLFFPCFCVIPFMYNKMPRSNVFRSLNFGNCVQCITTIQGKTEHFNHSRDSLMLLSSQPSSLPSQAAEYTFSSSAHGIFSRIDHMLSHKASLLNLRKLKSYQVGSAHIIFSIDVVQSLSHIQSLQPMDCNMPGFPVHHYLLEFAHVHCSNSCPLSQWCCPAISSSVAPFSCLQIFQVYGSFPLSQLFASGGQSTGASTSASVLPMNIQDWFPLGWTDLISLLSKGLSRVSSTAVPKCQFFSAQPSLWSNSHIHAWLLEKL